jgi:hypothetical protein
LAFSNIETEMKTMRKTNLTLLIASVFSVYFGGTHQAQARSADELKCIEKLYSQEDLLIEAKAALGLNSEGEEIDHVRVLEGRSKCALAAGWNDDEAETANSYGRAYVHVEGIKLWATQKGFDSQSYASIDRYFDAQAAALPKAGWLTDEQLNSIIEGAKAGGLAMPKDESALAAAKRYITALREHRRFKRNFENNLPFDAE